MDDSQHPNPLLRRRSIAGPFMRQSTGIPIPAEYKTSPNDTSNTTTTQPPPLTRANTVSGGWFGGLFGSIRRTSLSSSVGIPRPTIEPPVTNSEDSYGHLASSAPGQVTPNKHDTRDSLTSSGNLSRQSSSGAPHAPATSPPQSNVPPLARRLSETALQRTPSYGAGNNPPTSPHTSTSGSTAPLASSPATKPSILDADLRQGPIETDLFWLVLRDIGE